LQTGARWGQRWGPCRRRRPINKCNSLQIVYVLFNRVGNSAKRGRPFVRKYMAATIRRKGRTSFVLPLYAAHDLVHCRLEPSVR
jgi:hypothetical protein